jgi:GWxTD domain-containing protein
MRKNFLILLSFILLCSPLFLEEKLSPEHKSWLEEVKPIITKTERQIFLKLKNAEERNKFIQIFWKQRDTLPDTSENEFYKEYMKRIQFADSNFGRQTSKKGSQTDRGYFYLLLGPPLERTSFTTHSQLMPQELWYYRGEPEYGLPPYFYLIFYQPQGIGEYRLYNPGIEGPEKLVIHSMSRTAINRTNAFQMIKDISQELAGASLSYLPGERNPDVLSFTSNSIISGAYALAEKKFSDAYARSYLRYKDYVETEYSHNFIESSFKVGLFKNSNQYFIHWAIEPKKINMAFHEGRYYASYQFILRVEDLVGNPILEKEEEIPFIITPEQYKKHERLLFSFQDVLPIIPGNYKFFYLLKNKTAKDFISFQTNVFIPQEKGGQLLSNLLLYHKREELSESQRRKFKAFSFEGNHYLINTQNNFQPQEEMGVYFQAYNLREGVGIEKGSVLLEIFSLNESSPLHRIKKPLSGVLFPGGSGIDIESFSLSSLKPGYYRLEVSILDATGSSILNERENFILLAQPYPVLPWVFSRQHKTFPDPDHLFLLSTQYFMTQKYNEARKFLEQSFKIKDEPRTRLLLAKVLYALGRHEESLTLIFPVYQAAREREAAKIIALNYSGLKDWSSALIYLEKLMEESVEVSVLNLAAECYMNLNQSEKALPLIKKSLELNPNQEKIKEMEKKVKKSNQEQGL